MKDLCHRAFLPLLLALACGATGIGLAQANPIDPSAFEAAAQAKDTKARASVTGTGKSRFEAENEADRTARDVAGGSSYTVIRRTTNGSGTNWTCTLVIEYRQR